MFDEKLDMKAYQLLLSLKNMCQMRRPGVSFCDAFHFSFPCESRREDWLVDNNELVYEYVVMFSIFFPHESRDEERTD